MKLRDQLSKISGDLSDVKVTQAIQAAQLEHLEQLSTSVQDIATQGHLNTRALEEHMRRTDLLEQRVEQVDLAYKVWVLSFKLLGSLAAILGLVKLLTSLFL